MLRSFVLWLEKYILAVGLIGLVDVVLGILAFGTVLAALLGGPAVKAAGVVVAIVVLMGVFATLVANRSRAREEQARDRLLVARYCDLTQRARGAPLHIVEWDDVTVIDARGDVVNTVKVLARVRDPETYFFRFRFGAAWDQPVRHRAKVECVVRSGESGPRYDTTTSWLGDGRLEVLVHLLAPAKVGSDLRIVLELRWPGMCEPLVRKRLPDNYVLRFGRDTELVRYVVVLPEGENAFFERIGFAEEDEGYQVDAVRNAAGRVEVSLVARHVPAKHQFGLRLDLQ